MWEITSLLLSSSDLCNYIPAVPSWWEICRFWWSLELSSESNRICWRVKTTYSSILFLSFWSDNSTPKAMKWIAISIKLNQYLTLEWLEIQVTLHFRYLNFRAKMDKVLMLYLARKLKFSVLPNNRVVPIKRV